MLKKDINEPLIGNNGVYPESEKTKNNSKREGVAPKELQIREAVIKNILNGMAPQGAQKSNQNSQI